MDSKKILLIAIIALQTAAIVVSVHGPAGLFDFTGGKFTP